MVEQMRTPMGLASQMMGKLAENPGRVKWQLQVMFWLLQTMLYITCVLCLYQRNTCELLSVMTTDWAATTSLDSQLSITGCCAVMCGFCRHGCLDPTAAMVAETL